MSDLLGSNPIPRSRGLNRTYGHPHLLLVGGVDVVCGLIALVWPGVTILVLALIFGLMLLLAGLTAIAVGSAARRAGSSPILTWAIGALAVVAGLICIFHPGAGVWAIILGCSLWFLLTGVADLAVAAASPRHRLWFGVLGALSILAAVVLVVHPGVAVVTVAVVAGIAFLVRGAGEVSLGMMLRRTSR